MASSGDGGVTWGENRRLSDASSYWSFPATCNFHPRRLRADRGERRSPVRHLPRREARRYGPVHGRVAAPPDLELPAAVDRSGRKQRIRSVLARKREQLRHAPGVAAESATQSWLTGATPGLSGTQTLAAQGGSIVLTATLALPPRCTRTRRPCASSPRPVRPRRVRHVHDRRPLRQQHRHHDRLLLALRSRHRDPTRARVARRWATRCRARARCVSKSSTPPAPDPNAGLRNPRSKPARRHMGWARRGGPALAPAAYFARLDAEGERCGTW